MRIFGLNFTSMIKIITTKTLQFKQALFHVLNIKTSYLGLI